jgi:hypothetical protein
MIDPEDDDDTTLRNVGSDTGVILVWLLERKNEATTIPPKRRQLFTQRQSLIYQEA